MAWITILPRLFALKSRRWTMTNLLQRHYDKLLHGRTLGDLPPTPDLQIMCTSMTKGTSCSFDRRGIAFHQDPLHEISTTSLKLGFAVAASSAFPPLFPPVRVDHEVLMCGFNELPISEVLTDGGIFDNLGIERLIAAHEERQDTDLLVISDAEGSFGWAPDESYANLLTRNIRASDMLMRRVSLFQSGYLWAQRKDVLRIHIGNIISKDDDSSVPDPGTQRALRNVRTDLDKFSNREVAALIAHGYAVTRKMLVSSNVCKSAPTFSWAKITQMLGATPKQWERKDELESSSRRWRLLSITDLSTWITLGSISACFVAVLFFLVLLPSMQIRDLRKDNEILANSPSAYIRNNHEKSVIIFVHGINGDAVETWVRGWLDVCQHTNPLGITKCAEPSFLRRIDESQYSRVLRVMAIPDYQFLMLPVLREAARGEVRISAVVEALADGLSLSPEDRTALLPSGKQSVFSNRVHWAKSYLSKAGLVELTKRGHFKISPRGQEVLASNPIAIDNRFLNQFEEFREFRRRSDETDEAVSPPQVVEGLSEQKENSRRAHAVSTSAD